MVHFLFVYSFCSVVQIWEKIPVTGFKKFSCPSNAVDSSPNNYFLSLTQLYCFIAQCIRYNSFRLYSIFDPTWVELLENICHRFQKFLRSSDPELKLPNTDLTQIFLITFVSKYMLQESDMYLYVKLSYNCNSHAVSTCCVYSPVFLLL